MWTTFLLNEGLELLISICHVWYAHVGSISQSIGLVLSRIPDIPILVVEVIFLNLRYIQLICCLHDHCHPTTIVPLSPYHANIFTILSLSLSLATSVLYGSPRQWRI
jgi:hypothetical protein